jgi:hypothetical protein
MTMKKDDNYSDDEDEYSKIMGPESDPEDEDDDWDEDEETDDDEIDDDDY